MWDYSDKVLEHFMNPRNVGDVENPDGVGEVGSMACGDALRLTLKIDAEGRIEKAMFRTFGCGSAIASSSVLTEMVAGRTLEEAARITNEDIARELGGLPREKMHCSVMGREALEAAMIDYYKRQGRDVPCELIVTDVEICHCYQVKRSTIKNAVKQHKLKDVEDVTHYTKAGGGCTACHHDIRHIIDDVWEEMGTDAGLVTIGGLAPPAPPVREDARTAQIRDLVENDIARGLRTDGGDIELVRIVENRVHVRLTGACASCPASQATIKGWVESQLREHVSEDLEVVEERS
ncbi:MAG TPA: Fe-S cluster assembly protein NifU [Candidatus Krumholzibacteria bacterium]|nr:Fe-S cluster assembly protein NifU [Candidatus Krumholzibacteria bacterium]HRX50840.1 Fe-S cluster assembly protein NifU [Candidatus Krumholzibacteria bacterium]